MESEINDVEILLVEDNPSDEELTIHALKRNNITNSIHVARDGVEALEFIFGDDARPGHNRLAAPRVILLDLKLPLIDGLEVLRRIKADERTQAIPVVMLTSSREERDLIESYKLGVNSYIVKPVDFVQFTESIRQIGMYWSLLNQAPTPLP